jgi:hypothetical protein
MSRRNIIPEKYKTIHSYVFELHDILAQIIARGESKGLNSSEFKIKDKDIENIKDEDIWNWLKSNGYDDVIKDLIIKQVFFGVLSDMCHFIYEALTCSEKGKLTVTYALLRKPMKDNLLILEWLLSDPDDFLTRFRCKDSINFAPDKLSNERKREIIKKAEDLSDTGLDQHIFIYDLRYSKKETHSLEHLWNKANHIVTTFSLYKTESENLNFVFSDDESRLEQWDYLYTAMPLLMYHTVEVAITLLNKNIKNAESIIGLPTKIERELYFIENANEFSIKCGC